MPNLVKDSPCEPIQSQETEEVIIIAHSELWNEEIIVGAQLEQQVFEQHDEETLLAAGKDTGEEETVLCFFDELPLFMEQDENIIVQDMEDQELVQNDTNLLPLLQEVSVISHVVLNTSTVLKDEEDLGEDQF